ncbi:hypothetical protein CC85DRAFT_331674 [Cutaneotrichosporon oleaginosum]|uniref:Uncharacterized protein n=1 Tax=Cutaneotrichosporon oleaginosum TaxID=879819 RepID=A0A0J0XBA8_9TREE|nr:uncharacterized protein CC85DRAFT_331674 [Cutaneotrichosporon oleaginosum]KLT38371.1 hypothetical protein CC85DRAFT_331674 [Cutaneotrichosporon oleaginosum]TXT07563.1 hypothetical protein COLE_04487 [Cutaneotrichosporon oleaginosum]
MPYQDAFFHVQEHHPGVDVGHVLDLLKKQERVKFNDTNQVFMYEVSPPQRRGYGSSWRLGGRLKAAVEHRSGV